MAIDLTASLQEILSPSSPLRCIHSLKLRRQKFIRKSNHTWPTEQWIFLMPAELHKSSSVGLVLNSLFIWGELLSALSAHTLLTLHSQEIHCRQQIINQKAGNVHCVLQLSREGGYCSSCFWLLSLGHQLPGTQVWATPSAPACPFESGSRASTKAGPFTDSKWTARR